MLRAVIFRISESLVIWLNVKRKRSDATYVAKKSHKIIFKWIFNGNRKRAAATKMFLWVERALKNLRTKDNQIRWPGSGQMANQKLCLSSARQSAYESSLKPICL